MARKLLTKALALGILSLLATSPTDAGSVPRTALGTHAAVPPDLLEATPLTHGANAYSVAYGPVVGPFDVYSAGTGLRNIGTGIITLTAPAPLHQAYLYWVILEPTPSPGANVAQLNGVPVVGALIGVDVDPCWAAGFAWAYRADVTGLVPSGGLYLVTTASGTTTGADPWVSGGVPPLAEGASLVAVGLGLDVAFREVVIVDGYETSIGTLASAVLPRSAFPPANARLTVIGADGQTGAGDATFWNGGLLALDAWDGNVPQIPPTYTHGNLWDNDAYDVIAFPGANQVDVKGSGDCLGPTAFALSSLV